MAGSAQADADAGADRADDGVEHGAGGVPPRSGLWQHPRRTLRAERASDRIAHNEDPGRIARLAYTYGHLPLVAGIVITAASDEMVLAHPTGHADPYVAFCIVGGPALYLLANLFFKRTTGGWYPLSHLVGLGLFAGLALAAMALEPVALSIGSTAILMLVALWETIALRRT